MRCARLLIAVAALANGAAALHAPGSKAVFRGEGGPLATRREQAALVNGLEGTEVTKVATIRGGTTAHTVKVGLYFSLWYALNVGYNICNKKALNAVSIPYILALAQLFMGIPLVLTLWATRLRKAPRLSLENVKSLSPIAFMHMVAHLCAVVSLGAGAVSFTHIVKAAEPLFTALFSAAFLKQFFHPAVYATLVPVVAGVALASMKELSFSWLALGSAMGSNVASALRGILAKASMGTPKGENMDASNLYSVLTVLATLMLAPISLAVEGGVARKRWDVAMLAGQDKKELWMNIVMSGIFYYMYNEVAFLCLDQVHPITHAVGNTIKRVVLIAVSVVVFKSKLTPLAVLGSALAVGGVLMYSLAKDYYAKLNKPVLTPKVPTKVSVPKGASKKLK